MTNRPGTRLGYRHQCFLYGVGTLLLGSGALWLLFHFFVRVPGEFGVTAHPLEPWCLRVHGLSAAAFLIGFGSVLPVHVRRAWSAAHNRISGALFFGVTVLLIVTGYALYYVGHETARAWLSASHWAAGLGIPVFMALHVWRGRVQRRRQAAASRRSKPGGPAESGPVRLVGKG